MAKKQLTNYGLADLAVGNWATDGKPHGAGQLEARKLKSGDVGFYYRYTNQGKQERIPLGAGLPLAEARRRAGALSLRYQNGERDLRAILDAERREAERIRKDSQVAAELAAVRNKATLGALLTAYVTQLRKDGKSSARHVERAITLHVEKAWPRLWATSAHDVTDDDLMAVVARVADSDKLRAASKLRAYLRAAYAAAVIARHRAKSLPALREMGIRTNPAASLAPIEGEGTGARDRALSEAELRAYWQRISTLGNSDGALLCFHLLTGAQRVEQLSRLSVEDYDKDTQSVRIRDPKGRRRVARDHAVPLLPDALKAMQTMRGIGLGPNLFSVSEGRYPASYAMTQARLRDVAQAMQKGGEVAEPFTLGDLRRTVETRLAAAGVSLEIRAQLQSHGLGGVQAKHYDRHDYLNEKRLALETLHRLVTGATAKVTPIRRKKAG